MNIEALEIIRNRFKVGVTYSLHDNCGSVTLWYDGDKLVETPRVLSSEEAKALEEMMNREIANTDAHGIAGSGSSKEQMGRLAAYMFGAADFVIARQQVPQRARR